MAITKIHKANGKHFEFETHINEFLISREKTKSSETFLVIIKPDKYTHMHIHPDVEQTFYIISGKGIVWTKKSVSGKLKKACSIKTGDLVFIPLNNWHQIKSVEKSRLEYICFNSFPKGFLPGEKTALSHAKNIKKALIKKKMKNEK
ncbi:MAG: cupin domain-containing protein [Candidatus Paceibacterota bacterium]